MSMKRKIVFLVIALLAVSTTLLVAFNPRVGHWFQQQKGPRFQFAETTFDFGKITQGAVVDHIFKFANVGQDTLQILNVKPSCGCTATLVSANAIAPNESGEIKATFNSHGKEGKVKKMIFVTSNDVKEPQLTLFLVADIQRDSAKAEKAGLQ